MINRDLQCINGITPLHCAGANLQLLVNNNMLAQKGSCSNKNAYKSICLVVQLRHSRYIDNYADYTGG